MWVNIPMYFFDLRDALKTPSSWDLPTKLRRVPIPNLSVWGKTVPRCSSCSGQQQRSTPVYGNEANREVTCSTTEFWHCFTPRFSTVSHVFPTMLHISDILRLGLVPPLVVSGCWCWPRSHHKQAAGAAKKKKGNPKAGVGSEERGILKG